ncbi:MAG TPA: M28 family metallopeptidase, partial [bacterium]
MTSQKLIFYLLLILVPTLSFSQTEKFNADSAYAYIEHLSVTIGPRPMGSQNERIALDWAAEKFNSFGADSAYVMKFTKTESVNTNSGVVVGIFRGETDSTIVIGGHIDSAGREIPGANDNASGTASTIELARIWSQRERHYTMIFAAFGGEEQGLYGSDHFVKNYPDINKVVLMFSLDMAGSDDNIVTIFETDSVQAPKWLVKDAFAIDKALGINRLQYQTHFSAINNLGEKGAGSDHQPFLEKGIPAICFTNGINNSPIHTLQDRIDFIDKSMLDKYGQFADSLIKKYQTQRIPTSASKQNSYVLWQPFWKLIFIPHWLIVVLNIVALAFGIFAFIYSRNHRLRIEKPQRIRFSGLKLFSFIIVIAIFSQMGEALLQFIKSLRYP